MYPQELLPRKNLSVPATNSSSIFVRTLREFPYDCIDDNEFLPEITDAILAPNGDLEVFSLSLYIYGIYRESHFELFVTKNDETVHVPRKSGATRKAVAEKIKEDILYFAAKEVKEKFFEVYKDML